MQCLEVQRKLTDSCPNSSMSIHLVALLAHSSRGHSSSSCSTSEFGTFDTACVTSFGLVPCFQCECQNLAALQRNK